MESLFDLIFDNLWLIIAGIIFLAGFKRSKKKKDHPTKTPQPPTAESYADWEEEEDDWGKSPWDTIDDLPLPETVKKTIKNQWETSEPAPGHHYDAPWSGQGKVFPHKEVKPTVQTHENSHYDAPWSGEGRALPHQEVAPTVQVSSLPEPKRKASRKAVPDAYAMPQIETTALTPQKMVEAVVLAEILGKPKALRKRGE